MPARTDPGGQGSPAANPGAGLSVLPHALARLLASPPLLDRLARGEAEAVRRELSLTSSDMQALLAAGVPRLRRFARGLRIKRMRLVAGLMPVTTAMLQRCYGAERVADEFWSQFPPAADELGWHVRERHMEWCRRFAERLSTQSPPVWLGDLARYEEILERARRGISPAPAGDGGEAAAADGCPRLRPGVRLARFGHDVIALHAELAGRLRAGQPGGPLPAASQQATFVAAVPADTGQAGSGVCRLGPASFGLLRMCTGQRPVPWLASATQPGVPEGQALATATGIIRQAVHAGILVPEGARL